uniref:LAGLIDADG endonuclease n=1 Tax=Ramaria cf. rubripermanens TaxID=2016387 RepID=UPI0022388368
NPLTENLMLASVLPVLPTVGTVSIHALKKGKKKRLDKRDYLSIPYQFIAFLVGFIDGDGYIQITKTTKGFITIKLVIGIHLDDISTLEYIQSVLKIGKITIFRDHKSPNCKLIINRTDLQEVLFPLLLHHGIFFLTERRRAQFDLCMYIFKNDIKAYDQLSDIKKIPTLFELPKIISDYINLDFFKNWIVGFTMASEYPGLVEYKKENPLTYKRVKTPELRKKCSNKETYYALKGMFKKQNNNVKHYSTYVRPKNTEIVVWGTNLGSTVGTGRLTKIVKNMILLPPYQKSVVIGILLSDGNLASTKPHENPRLEFKQSSKNSAYVWFVFSILSHYCNVYPYSVINVRKEKVHSALALYTRGLPCFNELRSLFYINKVKRVPEDIYNLLTPVALAHLIMGDGSAKQHGLILCVDSYKIVDVVRLMNVLLIKYNLECTVRNHSPTQPRIYIRQRSMPILRELVKSHIIKSMLYKIGL